MPIILIAHNSHQLYRHIMQDSQTKACGIEEEANQTKACRTEEEANTLGGGKSCRFHVFRILFFLALIIGAVVGLSLAFTGSTNPLDYFVPVDPPGESEAFRWDAEAGLELEVLVRQHS
jgi:hypothetical protein